ncbi:uncharacterized protein PG986_009603 [Apiospora aurea]|uniref:Uncharacterized protein n=1 Tax=Apiospora aurea TaxID=335848 RepID=A0ABR1Q8T3_9PEZI
MIVLPRITGSLIRRPLASLSGAPGLCPGKATTTRKNDNEPPPPEETLPPSSARVPPHADAGRSAVGIEITYDRRVVDYCEDNGIVDWELMLPTP